MAFSSGTKKTCGLYYRPKAIVNDDSRVINKLKTSLTDDARVVSYNHHMSIVQATAHWLRVSEMKGRKVYNICHQMSLAWLGTAPTGMLFARYYRKTWTSVKPCGKDSWFRYTIVISK